MITDRADAERALGAIGQILQAEGASAAIVVIGGAALQLQGLVDRATRDVDIVALGDPPDAEWPRIIDPGADLPEPLQRARDLVADDLKLDPHWLNLGPALQWREGMPPGFEGRVHWQRYHALAVGVADRKDLIAFKLFAAADAIGPASVHYHDLLALDPTEREIDWAAAWVETQDVSPDFHAVVKEVVQHVERDRD